MGKGCWRNGSFRGRDLGGMGQLGGRDLGVMGLFGGRVVTD